MSLFHSTQVNGNLTLGENIADNGGIKTSYQAFQSLKNTTEQPMLPALPYTPDQLFFIAYGQVGPHCQAHAMTSYIGLWDIHVLEYHIRQSWASMGLCLD